MIHLTFSQLDSTNRYAAQWAIDNPDRPAVIGAVTQSSGRGRLGRAWKSPVGGAWFSVVWPMWKSPQMYDAVPLLAGLAVREVLQGVLREALQGEGKKTEATKRPATSDQAGSAEQKSTFNMTQMTGGTPVPPEQTADSRARLVHTDLKIKWPNDVLLNGRKVVGVLCERVMHGKRPSWATIGGSIIVGIGINVNFPASELGEDLRFPAISLWDVLGVAYDVEHIVSRCARQLEQRLLSLEHHGLTREMVDEAEEHLAFWHEPITVNQHGQQVTGICRGLDARGRLRLEVEGVERVIEVGDVGRVGFEPFVVG